MDSRKIFCVFRFIIYLLEMFFLYSMEKFLIFKLGTFSVSFLLIPSLMVFVSLFEGEIFGLFFACLGGFFLDFGFGVPIGIYASLLGILGYILGVLSNYFVNANFWITWLFSGFIGALILILRLFTNYSGYIWNDVLNIGLELYLPMIICTFLAVPIIFWFNRLIFYYIRSKRGEIR